MKQIERQERKNDYRTKEEKKAEKEQEKKAEQLAKDAEKARQEGITRHRSLQTDEVRDRMDEHLKQTKRNYGYEKEFFLVRWLRPKSDEEKKAKKDAKMVEKRMAATRKKAEANNEARRATSFEGKQRKAAKPKPGDYQHGGGGDMSGDRSKQASPSDMQHGGGGDMSGNRSKRANPSSIQHGGGGDMSGYVRKQRPGAEMNNVKATSPRKGGLFSKKSKPKPGD